MTEEKKIPMYTKIGARITIFLLLVIGVLMLKNCVGSIIYGTGTESKEIEYYHALGFSEGSRPADNQAVKEDEKISNPLLKKSYLKGFREGRDSARKGKTSM